MNTPKKPVKKVICVCGHVKGSHDKKGCKGKTCKCSKFQDRSKKPKKNGPGKAYREPQKFDVANLAEKGKKQNKGGRPPHYKDHLALQAMIDEYVIYCQIQENVMTISGLVYFLGFADRQSFYALEKRSGFSYTIKRARTIIETAYEQNLHRPGATGSIFALKNFGWKDEAVLDIKGAIPTTIVKNYEKKSDEKKNQSE